MGPNQRLQFARERDRIEGSRTRACCARTVELRQMSRSGSVKKAKTVAASASIVISVWIELSAID
jgi:hypothetical protein